jgi:hypothetical protein
MLTIVTGALAGLFHVLSGPDHLAAVAPIVATGRKRGWIAGWTWGVGHASGVVVVALVAVLLRDVLPPVDLISAWSERLVGAALVGIGLWALGRSLRIGPAHHAHGAVAHDHVHVRSGPPWVRRLGHAHASFYVGILHGVAGSSHFLGVLPALALPTRTDALLYICSFGAGTVVAMTAFAATIGAIGVHTRHVAWAHRGMLVVAAVVALSVGAWWLVVGV